MGFRDTSINIFNGIGTLMYLFLAILAFTATYPFYQAITALPGMSTIVAITMSLCWWIVCFTTLYMGTQWVYEGRVKDSSVKIVEGWRR